MWDIPFRLLASVITGFFIGMFIDNYLSMEVPIFAIIGSMLGLIAGIWSCVKKTL